MSGNPAPSPVQALPTRKARPDRRVLRTRDALGDALLALMQEQAFDSITVQQVLDRAGVSRATFYTHYRDKDDLLLSDVEDFLGFIGTLLTRLGAPPERIAPVAELFAHIGEMSALSDAIIASGRGPDVRELAIGSFARSIQQRLTLAGVSLPVKHLAGISHALAGALFSLLDWWLGAGKAMPPEEVDALFHRLVWSSLRA